MWYCPGFQYEYEQSRFGSSVGFESVALPFQRAVIPGKTGSSWSRNRLAYAATCEFAAVA